MFCNLLGTALKCFSMIKLFQHLINLEVLRDKRMSSQVEISGNSNVSAVNEEYNDLLDRKKLAKNFVSVLTPQNANVFSINGGWGTGKTWFLKFIEEECYEQNIPFVQYNVWENDYFDSPFKVVISEIIELLKKYYSEQNKEIAEVEKRVKNILEFLVPFGPALKLDISKIVDVTTYAQFKELKRKFVESLEKCLENQPQMVIAIDELDRCRPDYAIRTLEIIKHFFNIKGIKFILAVDKKQLANTVKALYGQDAETDCYLRKFVDIEYNLPEPNKKEFIHYLITEKYKIIGEKIIVFGEEKRILYPGFDSWSQEKAWVFHTKQSENQQYAINTVYSILDTKAFSLRTIEKILLRLSIIIKQLSEKTDVLETGFLLQLIIFNMYRVDVFNECKKSRIYFSQYDIEDIKLVYAPTEIINKTLHLNLKSEPSPRGEYRAIYASGKELYKYYKLINMAEDYE